jgi:hypothetical protein
VVRRRGLGVLRRAGGPPRPGSRARRCGGCPCRSDLPQDQRPAPSGAPDPRRARSPCPGVVIRRPRLVPSGARDPRRASVPGRPGVPATARLPAYPWDGRRRGPVRPGGTGCPPGQDRPAATGCFPRRDRPARSGRSPDRAHCGGTGCIPLRNRHGGTCRCLPAIPHGRHVPSPRRGRALASVRCGRAQAWRSPARHGGAPGGARRDAAQPGEGRPAGAGIRLPGPRLGGSVRAVCGPAGAAVPPLPGHGVRPRHRTPWRCHRTPWRCHRTAWPCRGAGRMRAGRPRDVPAPGRRPAGLARPAGRRCPACYARPAGFGSLTGRRCPGSASGGRTPRAALRRRGPNPACPLPLHPPGIDSYHLASPAIPVAPRRPAGADLRFVPVGYPAARRMTLGESDR